MAQTAIDYSKVSFFDYEGNLMTGYSKREAIRDHAINWRDNVTTFFCGSCNNELPTGMIHSDGCKSFIAIWDEDVLVVEYD